LPSLSLAIGCEENSMDMFVNGCVILTTVFAFGYLTYVMLKPERF
jgi:hypothetical protein